MTHEEVFSLMMDALDDALAPAGADRLEEHLAVCADCRAEWSVLQLVDDVLAGAPTIPAPAGFAERVSARLVAASWPRTLGALFTLSLGSLAALLIVAVPAAVLLIATWAALSQPAGFAQLAIGLQQLARMGAAVLGASRTTLRILLVETTGSPLFLSWAVALGLVLAAWAHVLGGPPPVRVRGG